MRVRHNLILNRSDEEWIQIFMRVFLLDKGAGSLIWRERENKYSRARIGSIAGVRDRFGHLHIKVGGSTHLAHRIVWAMAYGKMPTMGLDHINRVPDDNRICNLREATSQQSGMNQAGKRTGKLKGAYVWKRGPKPYCSYIKVNGRRKFLGYFDDEMSAHLAYFTVAKAEFGEFAYAGVPAVSNGMTTANLRRPRGASEARKGVPSQTSPEDSRSSGAFGGLASR